jgi:hypothetical protein
MMLGKWLQIAAMLGAVALAGCATATPVMDAGDGTYLISARAAPVRGGATGAQTVAYTDAQKFCAQKGDGLHPIVCHAPPRAVRTCRLRNSSAMARGRTMPEALSSAMTGAIS